MNGSNILLISGKLQSGKNTFCNLFESILTDNKETFINTMFAKALKDNSKEDFKLLTDYLNEISKKYNIPELYTRDENWYEDKTDITRKCLQLYGTNIFRNRVDENYWIRNLVKFIDTLKQKWILITDVRFENEIELVKEYFKENKNVYSIRIERDIDRKDNVNFHESEKALDNYKSFDFVVKNDKDLKHLENEAIDIFKRISK